MSSGSENSAEINRWLQRLRDGDASARQDLIHTAQNRLIRLARKMLGDFPRVRRWEETDDVFQNAVIRLCRSLDHVIPDSASALISLAARDTRCALIDLARHYYGPQGHGANHHSAGDSSSLTPLADPADDTHDPTSLAYWSEFHHRVQDLPPEQQQVMDLVWYHGLSQAEAADLLNISERTLQRRWRQVCLSLHEAMGEPPPGSD